MHKKIIHKRYTWWILTAIFFAIIIISFTTRKNNEQFLAYWSWANTFDLRTQWYIVSHNALQDKDFEKIIQTLPKQTAQDYYNHGTIRIAYAYTLSKKTWYQDHVQAQEHIQQAHKELQIAKEYAPKQFRNKIQTNDDIATYIETTLEKQLCISSIDELYRQIKTIEQLTTPIEQPQIIPSSANISCTEQLNNYIENSYEQTTIRQNKAQERQENIQSLLYEYRDDITACTQPHNSKYYRDITTQIQAQIQQYNFIQQQIQDQQRESLENLCETQSDNLQENTIQETIEKIDKETVTSEETQGQTSTSWDNQSPTEYWPSYESIEDQQRKSIMNSIRETQTQRIQHIQNTDSSTQEKIQNLFQEFYGNPDDIR